MIHLSKQSWDVFDETGVMLPTLDDYSATESE